MSILLFVIGAITLVAGALAIGFGIPVNEFSFGNTLIMAGTTAAVGGLIVIGLGAVVGQLQRVIEVIAMRAPLRPNRPPESFDAGRPPVTGRVPFTPTPKPEPDMEEAPPVAPPLAAASAAAEEQAAEPPTLPNPDVPPVEPPPVAAPVAVSENSEMAPLDEPAAPRLDDVVRNEFAPETETAPAWRPVPRPAAEPSPPDMPLSAADLPPPEPARTRDETDFEAVWPASAGRFGSRRTDEPRAAAPAEPAAPAPAEQHGPLAILKSGVVDGMAYTLYVDGSIEAELPQGTLRFASINELREHLEKTT